LVSRSDGHTEHANVNGEYLGAHDPSDALGAGWSAFVL
jgi:hypothetical protein